MVKTRSQVKKEALAEEQKKPENAKTPLKPLYDVHIDFDEASQAWLANKKHIGNGHYKYICTVEKHGTKCGKSCYKELAHCWVHRSLSSKP